MTATTAQPLALPERSHVHDLVADELGIDPQQLLADLAADISEPLVIRELVA